MKAIGMGGVAVEETLEQDIESWERGDKGKRKRRGDDVSEVISE